MTKTSRSHICGGYYVCMIQVQDVSDPVAEKTSGIRDPLLTSIFQQLLEVWVGIRCFKCQSFGFVAMPPKLLFSSLSIATLPFRGSLWRISGF